MKTRKVLSWFLLAGMLASGAAQATPPDRGTGAIYGNALHIAWLQGENRIQASLEDIRSHLIGDKANDRGDLQAYRANLRTAARSGGQLMLHVYALGCVVYLAFIFLLGLFVGFNELDRDK